MIPSRKVDLTRVAVEGSFGSPFRSSSETWSAGEPQARAHDSHSRHASHAVAGGTW